MTEDKLIHVHLDERALWTADLYSGGEFIANLGGSYPKSNSTVIDAKRTWGDFEVQVGGNAPESLRFMDSLPEIEIIEALIDPFTLPDFNE